MARMKIGRVRAACEAAGVTFVRCNANHWQLRTAHFIVNVWPSTDRVHVSGTEHSAEAPRSVAELVRLAQRGPPVGKLARRKQMTSEKRRLFAKAPRCHWCKAALAAQDATVDHRIPLARGGTNRRDNLVLACRDCNQRRGSEMPEVEGDRARDERGA